MVWPCLDMCLVTCVHVSGHVWTCVYKCAHVYGHVHMCLAMVGHVLEHVCTRRRVWPHLDMCLVKCPHVFGHVWACVWSRVHTCLDSGGRTECAHVEGYATSERCPSSVLAYSEHLNTQCTMDVLMPANFCTCLYPTPTTVQQTVFISQWQRFDDIVHDAVRHVRQIRRPCVLRAHVPRPTGACTQHVLYSQPQLCRTSQPVGDREQLSARHYRVASVQLSRPVLELSRQPAGDLSTIRVMQHDAARGRMHDQVAGHVYGGVENERGAECSEHTTTTAMGKKNLYRSQHCYWGPSAY